MAHSNQIREFVLTDQGFQLLDIYVGTNGLLTGSARVAQEAKELMDAEEVKRQLQRRTFDLKQKHRQLESQISKMRSDFRLEVEDSRRGASEMQFHEKQVALNRLAVARARKADMLLAHVTDRDGKK
jgi:circadian clock protein KaiC